MTDSDRNVFPLHRVPPPIWQRPEAYADQREVRHITIASRRDRWTLALSIAATTAIVFVLLVGALAVLS